MYNPYSSLEILDSLIYLGSYNTGQIQRFKIMNIEGSNKYSKQGLNNLISFSMKQNLGLCEDFGGDVYYQDYIKDNNNHIHLFNIQSTYILSNLDPLCYDNLLTHLEFDLNGNIHKISYKVFRDSSTLNLRNSTESLFAIPQNDSLCNFLIFSADRKFDFYRFISYDFQKDSILIINNRENNSEISNIIPSSSQYSGGNLFRRTKISINNHAYLAICTNVMDIGKISAILKIDSLGNINNHIVQGNIFADQNSNCIKNTTDKNLPQIIITAQNNNFTAYTSSDNNGNYYIGVGDSGTYTITAQSNINYPLFEQGNCYQGTTYAYLDSVTFDTLNLALKPTILCPNMYVDISTPFLRRCFSNIYTVNYKNNGTIASPSTFVDVTLDRFLTVNNASRPYTNIGNNTLRFQLGNVDYLTSGSFTIDVTVHCDSTVLGQTHCVEAHIYPDTVCAVANYTGAVISATALCKGDSVEFKLRNSGGNMLQRKRYIVIEDNLNKLGGTYQLSNGQQHLITIKADSGRTYGIIAEQDNGFPSQLGDKYASAFIEGCNAGNDTFSTGIVTQYPEFDGEPYRSVDCQQNIGAYDPNDKTGYPIGVTANNHIEKNIALDYHINFQNTGTDTAFKVVIVDSISKYLDINTIEPGASSHRYTFIRTDSNAIKFIFDSINLVDSNKNEKLSHGFVKFRIQQKPDNANGTKIYNQAEIYFDYNSPIFTNTTTHTIGDVYLRILTSTIQPKYNQANIKVYPNPFRDNAVIVLQNMALQQTTLILYNMSGKEIMQLQSNTNQYQIDGNDLEKGMYLFKIKNDKDEIANGKIVLQ